MPKEYVFGLDMGLSEQDAGIFLDELGDRGASAGLSSQLGGLPYDELGVTGFGVDEAADYTASTLGIEMSGTRVTIQGFGAVGVAAAKRFVELGGVVVCVSTVKGVIHDPDGLQVDALVKLQAELGDDCVTAHTGRLLSPGEELQLPTDILVPAARQDVIDGPLAQALDAKLIVEAANMPITTEAKAVLHARGIPIVPDFIANAGGAIAAAYSMDCRYSPFRPGHEEVFSAISEKMRKNAAQVITAARSQGCTSHEAALRLAEDRVAAAMRLRGQPDPTDGLGWTTSHS